MGQSFSTVAIQRHLRDQGIGFFILSLVVALALSVGCSTQAPLLQQATTTNAQTNMPTKTVDQPTPTATDTPVPSTTPPPPTETPAPATPTATPTPGLVEGGFQIACLPFGYELPITSAVFASTELLIQKFIPGQNGIVVNIPARACGVFLTTNRPLEGEVFLELFEGSNPTAWYSRRMESVEGRSNTYYAVLDHDYIVNHPYWSQVYPLKIHGGGQVFWEGNLELSRTYFGLCWEGSVPDPVTLRCPKTDKLEREPHFDMPTFVPGGLE